MNHFQKFQQAISIDDNDNNNFIIEPNTDYFVGNTPHGGYLMALMHKALTTVLPHSTAISSSVQYLNRIDPKPLTLEVEVLKIGKGSSSGIVKLLQDNKVCTTFTGTCSDFHHMKGFDGLKKQLPKIFSDKHIDEYVDLNYDEISKGFTPSFICLLYTSPSPRDGNVSRMPSSA